MRIVTFGEVMLRLCPEEFQRVRQSIPGRLEATFGGGELNVAVSVALQGGQSAFLTALPDNPITDSLVQELGKLGVDASLVKRTKQGRFGIYFVETGANQRGGTVIYDRDGSSISLAGPDSYDWKSAFAGANWFHITGITPAISRSAADAALASVHAAKAQGLTVSCDLNFRKKLWNWDVSTKPVELARRVIQQLIRHVDVVIANEEDAEMTLGISDPTSDVDAGQINTAGYVHVAQRIVEQFPNVSKVAITLRESFSASHNNWGAMLFDAQSGSAHFAPLAADGSYSPYQITNIVDRVGAGDSFAGGLVFALNTPELADSATALKYAVAASCLKHSIKGDFNYSTRAEIEALMKGSGSGRVQR